MEQTDPSDFLRVLAPAVRQAASIARAMEGRVQNRPKDGEATEVKAALTIADSASQEAILVPLLEHFPEVGLEAEEDTPSVACFSTDADPRVVIDPIDGTLHFYLGHAGPYAVMVGLCRAGLFEASLVALPREGVQLEARRGGGAWSLRPRARPREVRAAADGARVLVSHGMPEPALERLRRGGLEPLPACGGAISVAPLLPGVRAGLRMVAPGASVSTRGRIGARISAEGGARIEMEGGRPFPERVEEPARLLLLAAVDDDLAVLRDAGERALA